MPPSVIPVENSSAKKKGAELTGDPFRRMTRKLFENDASVQTAAEAKSGNLIINLSFF